MADQAAANARWREQNMLRNGNASIGDALAILGNSWIKIRVEAAQAAPLPSSQGPGPAQPVQFVLVALAAQGRMQQALSSVDECLDLSAGYLVSIAMAYLAILIILSIMWPLGFRQLFRFGVIVTLHILLTAQSLIWDRSPFSRPSENNTIGDDIVGSVSLVFILMKSSRWYSILFWWAGCSWYFQDALQLAENEQVYTRVLNCVLILSLAFIVKRFSVQWYTAKWAYKIDAQRFVQAMQNMLVILALAQIGHTTNTAIQIETATLSLHQTGKIAPYSLRLFKRAVALIQKERRTASDTDIIATDGLYDKLLELQKDDVNQDHGKGLVDPEGLNLFRARLYFTSEIDKLFRLVRDNGCIKEEKFVWCIDTVYKAYHSMKYTTISASQVAEDYEWILDMTVFYPMAMFAIAYLLGYDPNMFNMPVLTTVSSGALWVGVIPSKWISSLFLEDFTTTTLMATRRPYAIGDLVQVRMPDSSSDFDSFGVENVWRVVNFTFSRTKFVRLHNNEPKEMSSEELAACEIKNWSLLQPTFRIFLKVPVDTPVDRIEAFFGNVAEYASENPSEWLPVDGFNFKKNLMKRIRKYIICRLHTASHGTTLCSSRVANASYTNNAM